jgi:hypothetical protein
MESDVVYVQYCRYKNVLTTVFLTYRITCQYFVKRVFLVIIII